MGDNIMTAQKIRLFNKIEEQAWIILMERRIIRSDATYIKNILLFQANFEIKKSNQAHGLGVTEEYT